MAESLLEYLIREMPDWPNKGQVLEAVKQIWDDAITGQRQEG